MVLEDFVMAFAREQKGQPEIVQEDNEESILVQMDMRDFICPISQCIIYESSMAQPCGHIFEKKEIEKARQIKQECPCCKNIITSCCPNPFFDMTLEKALQIRPQLQKERYFCMEYLETALRKNVLPSKLVQYLKATGELSQLLNNESTRLLIIQNFSKFDYQSLNTVCEQDGTTAMFKLLRMVNQIVNGKLLENHWKAKIGVESMNAIEKKSGASAVTYLAVDFTGMMLLEADPSLLAKINEQGLNAIHNIWGISAVTSFIASQTCNLGGAYRRPSEGPLFKDAEFRSKINEHGLNAVSKMRGCSAVTLLASTMKGQMLLTKDDVLRAKINEQGLNAIDKISKMSAVSYLAGRREGRLLLAKDAALRSKINEKGLNAVDKKLNLSAVICFAATPEGREILAKDKRLRALILKDELNRIVQQGEYKGESAAICLLASEDGKELLKQDRELLDKIDFSIIQSRPDVMIQLKQAKVEFKDLIAIAHRNQQQVFANQLMSLNAVRIEYKLDASTRLAEVEKMKSFFLNFCALANIPLFQSAPLDFVFYKYFKPAKKIMAMMDSFLHSGKPGLGAIQDNLLGQLNSYKKSLFVSDGLSSTKIQELEDFLGLSKYAISRHHLISLEQLNKALEKQGCLHQLRS